MSELATSQPVSTRPVAAGSSVRSNRRRPLRLFYASGPGDNLNTYHHWKQNQDDPGEPVVPYSGQFYDLCRDYDARGYVLSTCPRRDRLRDGRFLIEHRPYVGRSTHGALFHLAQFWYGLGLLVSALRFRPDVAIINEGAHWFMLAVLDWAGVRVVPSLHVRLDWVGRDHWGWRLINRLNRRFFRWNCAAVLVASRRIAEDVQRLAGTGRVPILEFLPLYRRSTFAQIKPADCERRPFNVLFVGRVEANKGVFDLLQAAHLVWTRCPDVHFHLCGVGSALPELQARVARENAGERFYIHGYCDRARLAAMYDLSHVVVVPTRSEFGEGFNQVTSEGILAGRPVITSSVCPAVAYVSPAVVQVPPDDVRAYADAIVRLGNDRAFYREKQDACLAAQEQFYDEQRSWGAVVRRLIQTCT
jgi:glycosyltransferase involved in cell wall biosynthesis